MRTRILAVPSIVALAAALAGCSRPAPVAEPVRAVRTAVVTTDSAGGTLEYAGEVRARIESRLSFRIGGKITRRLVNVGDAVTKGQPLAELDPQDARLGQEASRAALTAADVNLAQAKADFDRFRELKEQGFISAAELERRETALKAARASYDQARAQATVQGNQAAYATLLADAAGVVTGVDAEPGMVVAAGTPVLRVANDGPRDVVFSVPEDRLARLRAAAARPGALRVRLWGSGETLPASVREVSAAADAATRTLLVKAALGTAKVTLGQTATVLLELPRTEGVMRLPLAAVAQLQGKTSVWLVDPATMTVRPQPIDVGGAEGNSVVVKGGLAPGQRVVTAGVHVLSPGQKVRLYVEPSPVGGVSAPAIEAPPVPAAAASGAAS